MSSPSERWGPISWRALAANDILRSGLGADVLDGGAGGADAADYRNSAVGVTVNLGTGTGAGGTAAGDTLTGIEQVFGSNNDDTITGGAGNNLLRGGLGADMLDGGAGGGDIADYRDSAVGVTVNLGTGTGLGGTAAGDTLASIEQVYGSNHDDTITGGAGNNLLRGGLGADMLDGGAGGGDVADYRESTAGVTVNLGTGTGLGGSAEGDTLANIEQVYGSDHDDTITGGAGNDLLRGGLGADMVNGGAGGGDIADYRNSAAGVTVDLGTGTGLGGSAEGDTLANIEQVYGSDHDDTITGDAGNNLLRGGLGADMLDGGAGGGDVADYRESTAGVTVDLAAGTGLGGSAEGDTLVNIEQVYGSDHGDTLAGGTGTSLLRGPGGDDTFAWRALNGRMIVDGGTEDTLGDTFVIQGDATAETFDIFTQAEALASFGYAGSAEIVVTRNGASLGNIIAELTEIEEITVNSSDAPSNDAGGAVVLGGDTVNVHGDFSVTSLFLNTITIQGTAGDDVVDITGLNSEHRIVFKSAGGRDRIVGDLRPQDVIMMAAGTVVGDYAVTSADGLTTVSDGTNSVTVASSSALTIMDESGVERAFQNGSADTSAAAIEVSDGVTVAVTDDSSAAAVQNGTAGDDVLLGTAEADVMIGGGGEDIVMGAGGGDFAFGDGRRRPPLRRRRRRRDRRRRGQRRRSLPAPATTRSSPRRTTATTPTGARTAPIRSTTPPSAAEPHDRSRQRDRSSRAAYRVRRAARTSSSVSRTFIGGSGNDTIVASTRRERDGRRCRQRHLRLRIG